VISQLDDKRYCPSVLMLTIHNTANEHYASAVTT